MHNEHDAKGCILKNIVFQGLRAVLHAYAPNLRFGVCSTFVSGPNPRKLAQLYHAKSTVTVCDQKEMYTAMVQHILAKVANASISYCGGPPTRVLSWGGGHLCSLILQDTLCKFCEVLVTTLSGLGGGKFHKAPATEEATWSDSSDSD